MRGADERVDAGAFGLELDPHDVAAVEDERLAQALDLGRMRRPVDADEIDDDVVAFSDDDLARRPSIRRRPPSGRSDPAAA